MELLVTNMDKVAETLETMHKEKNKDIVYDIFTCNTCGLNFPNKKLLNKHEGEKHTHPCDQCEYKGNNTEEVEEHIRANHYLHRYNCDKCEYKAGDPTLVEIHIQKIHVEAHVEYSKDNVENIFYACKECDYNTYDTNETCLPAHNCDHYFKTL